ncbi:MAG: hypothetical protein DBX59_06010 [Bacillota bacterium]|nr:MAG: hypothetical protein DBX59_06010 [Bacillota bacterium]
MKRFNAKKIATLSLLCALSLLAFLLESLFPPLFFAGAKLGLSNIFTLLALVMFGGAEAGLTVLAKCLLGALFGGNFSALMYSLPASFAALLTEYLLFRFLFPKISLVSVSVAAALVHSAVQNVVFALVTQTKEALVYLPYLAVIGAIAGVAVGFAVYLTVKILPKNLFDNQRR